MHVLRITYGYVIHLPIALVCLANTVLDLYRLAERIVLTWYKA